MGDAIEQGSCHFGIAEHGHPFGERQVGCDNQRGLLVKLANQMEQEGAAGGRERQIAQFIEDHSVGLDQLSGQISCFPLLFFALQLVHQIDRVIKADAFALMDGGNTQSRGQVGFAGSGSAYQDQVVRCFHKGGARQLLDLGLWQRRFRPIDPGQIAMHREARGLDLVTQAANLAVGKFGIDQPIQRERPAKPFSC